MRRATTAPDALPGDPDRGRERHAHAPEHEIECGRYRTAESNESVGPEEIIEAEHQGEGREEREQHQ